MGRDHTEYSGRHRRRSPPPPPPPSSRHDRHDRDHEERRSRDDKYYHQNDRRYETEGGRHHGRSSSGYYYDRDATRHDHRHRHRESSRRPSLSPQRDYRRSERPSHDSRHDRGRPSPLDGEPVKFDRNRRLSPFRGEIVPLGQRPRALNNWDAAPPGFERIRADIAKQTGLFPPPGNVAKIANFAPPVLDPARAAMLAMLSGETSDTPNVFVGGAAFGAAYAKHSKRVYVGNLPVSVTEQELEDFFNSLLQSDRPINGSEPGAAETEGRDGDGDGDGERERERERGNEEEAAVVGVVLSNDKTYAFVDFRSPELTNMALDMNGMHLSGSSLKIKRPRDPAEAASGAKADGASEEDTSGDTFVLSNVPLFLQDAHVRLLLQLIGDLKVFIFLRQRNAKTPLGITVFQFDERIFNDIARDVFSSVSLSEHGALVLRSLAECRGDPQTWSVLSSFCLIPDTISVDESPVVQLVNLIPLDAIAKTPDAGYDMIEQLVREEAARHGAVSDVALPRPLPGGRPTPGLGMCYVRYSCADEARAACEAFGGRRFNEDIVLASLYPLDRFEKRDF